MNIYDKWQQFGMMNHETSQLNELAKLNEGSKETKVKSFDDIIKEFHYEYSSHMSKMQKNSRKKRGGK